MCAEQALGAAGLLPTINGALLAEATALQPRRAMLLQLDSKRNQLPNLQTWTPRWQPSPAIAFSVDLSFAPWPTFAGQGQESVLVLICCGEVPAREQQHSLSAFTAL